MILYTDGLGIFNAGRSITDIENSLSSELNA